RYNERIRLNGETVSDALLCQSFERIDQARGETSLTYFEFGTLAAFDLFARAALDVAVVEVGLGGRLDAANLLDADVALITAIDIDHAAWLGHDRETIAIEKGGIMRPGRPAICSDPQPPQSLIRLAAEKGAPLYLPGRDYRYGEEGGHWWWGGGATRYDELPLPALRGQAQLQNAAGVLMVLQQLAPRLPVAAVHLREGLQGLRLPGRFQVMPGAPLTIFDVAHNPQSAQVLAANLRTLPAAGETHAVVAMLADKDLRNTLQPLKGVVSRWYPAGLAVARGASGAALQQVLLEIGAESRESFATVTQALAAARRNASVDDRIVVFGSFYTVAEALVEPVAAALPCSAAKAV
ncbi:MAG: bifunctional folylpolyglutamate synthase/dihydrofolate synthase, partial [Gammaproteobacteria bacterium]|nr:bifunctional folylpolyglutamate synthase/dihydrofolate synthase [Gammaproteobacteria bacterium]